MTVTYQTNDYNQQYYVYKNADSTEINEVANQTGIRGNEFKKHFEKNVNNSNENSIEVGDTLYIKSKEVRDLEIKLQEEKEKNNELNNKVSDIDHKFNECAEGGASIGVGAVVGAVIGAVVRAKVAAVVSTTAGAKLGAIGGPWGAAIGALIGLTVWGVGEAFEDD